MLPEHTLGHHSTRRSLGFVLAAVIGARHGRDHRLLPDDGEGALPDRPVRPGHPEDRHRAAARRLVRLRPHPEDHPGGADRLLPGRHLRRGRACARPTRSCSTCPRRWAPSPWQTFRKIRFPNALPHLMAGLKVAVTLAVVGAVVGEFVGATEGLGYVLLLANGNLDAPLLFADLILMSRDRHRPVRPRRGRRRHCSSPGTPAGRAGVSPHHFLTTPSRRQHDERRLPHRWPISSPLLCRRRRLRRRTTPPADQRRGGELKQGHADPQLGALRRARALLLRHAEGLSTRTRASTWRSSRAAAPARRPSRSPRSRPTSAGPTRPPLLKGVHAA